MKKLLSIALTVTALVSASSCAVTKYTSEVPAAVVTPVALLQPLSYVEYVGKNGDVAASDSLSAISTELLTGIVSGMLPVDCVIPVEYTDIVASEVTVLPGLDPKMLLGATVPDATRNLILDSGHRYGAVVFASGFTKSVGRYAADAAKGILLGIATAVLTMGTVSTYGVATKCASQVSIMIVDAQENRVIYYNRTPVEEQEPARPGPLQNQARRVLKGFK